MMKAGETTPPRGQSFIASAPSGGNKLPLIQWQPWLKSILSPPCLSVADFRDYQTGRESVCDANSHQENMELTFPQCSCHSSPSYAVFVYPILLKNGTKTVKNYLFFNMLILIWFQQYSSYPQTGRELSADITPTDVAIFLSKSSTRLEGEHGCTILLFWCGSKAILLCFLGSILFVVL